MSQTQKNVKERKHFLLFVVVVFGYSRILSTHRGFYNMCLFGPPTTILVSPYYHIPKLYQKKKYKKIC